MTQAAPKVTSIDDHIVTLGQQAWTAEKATVKAQRERWVTIGRALQIGRKLHPSNQAYGKWTVDKGFDEIARHARADSMWLVDNLALCAGCTTEGHPTHVRAWFNDQETNAVIPEELQSVNLEPSVPVFREDQARKVNKLIHRSKSGDEGSPIAERMVKATAKKLGITVDELTQAAAEGDPEGHFSFDGNVLRAIGIFREETKVVIGQMKDIGMSREQVRAIFMSITNSI